MVFDVVAFVHRVEPFHLRTERPVDLHVGEYEHGERRDHCRIGEDETEDVVADDEVEEAERDGDEPDGGGDQHGALVAHSRAVFQWRGDGNVAVQRQRRQAQ